MKKLCVIGDPVAHSLSPRIHGCLIRETGVAYSYGICPVSPGELEDFVEKARRGAYAGYNVTMPHKQAIVPLLDELTPEAAACGAVNTVRVADGRSIGHNTDAQGFLSSLGGWPVSGKTALLLGAGGAGTAVAVALAGAGVKKLYVCNRSAERSGELVCRWPGRAEPVDFAPLPMARAAEMSDLIVNATPLGMSGRGDFPAWSFLEAAAPGTVVYDLVYHPERTALLRTAERRGLATVGGIELLIHQAILAFSFFTGVKVNTQAAAAAVRQVL